MKKLLCLIAAVAAVLAISGCASDYFSTLYLDEDTREGSCLVDETVKIALKGNATAGYEWRYTMEGFSLAFKDAKYDVDGSASAGLVGVGGTKTFTFTAKKPGLAVVRMYYGRPWERTYIKEEIFKILVK